MDNLFELSISCITEENYWIEYSIGIFKSTEDIDTVIKRLMSKDGKFFDSDCEVHISEIEVIGEGVDIESVYRFWGQNRDKSFEGDIVESPCYIDKRTAIQELLKTKKNTPQQQ